MGEKNGSKCKLETEHFERRHNLNHKDLMEGKSSPHGLIC